MSTGTLILGALLAAAAAAVLMIYRLEVFRDVMSGFGRKQDRRSSRARTELGLNRVADLRAREERLAREAKRRMQPLMLETVRAVEAPNGTVTVLARNAGGFATEVRASSARSRVHVTPTTIEPDGEVQFTFSEVDDNAAEIDARLDYVSAYGQSERTAIAYVRGSREIRHA